MTNRESLTIIEEFAKNTSDTKLFMALAHAAAALRCVVNTEKRIENTKKHEKQRQNVNYKRKQLYEKRKNGCDHGNCDTCPHRECIADINLADQYLE